MQKDNHNLPLVAVTLGDPAGIGPEIVVRALANPELCRVARPLVVGDVTVLHRAAEICGLHLEINPLKEPDQAGLVPGRVDVWPVEGADLSHLEYGRIQPQAGRASFLYIQQAIELALARKVDAVATAPINKEALRAARIDFIGHTEIFAALTGAPYALTMFAVENLRIFFLTRHLALREACAEVKADRIVTALIQIQEVLQRLGLPNPQIAVAALNPHAGEGGLFGQEEKEEIEPAVREAQTRGIRAVGPVPADSVFHLGRLGRYDAILSLYHDQGHIAAKTLDFARTVSVTLGLPFIRTSVDHGTAYDIAGKGLADQTSMEEAIKRAAEYARFWNRDWANR